MQDTILLQYLSKKMHTHAYKLTIDGEITFSCCKVLAFQDTYIKDKDFLDFLLESPPQGIPCLRSIRQKDIYGIVTGHNAIYIVGPVSFASPVYLNCDYNELMLEEEIEKYVPQVNPDDYLEDILFLNHMITGVESTTEQIIETNCLNHDHTVKVQKHFNDILFENNENNIHHNPYDQEMREFGSIENGDLIQLEKSMQEDYDGTIGTLAKDPLRNLKNLGIVLATQISNRHTLQYQLILFTVIIPTISLIYCILIIFSIVLKFSIPNNCYSSAIAYIQILRGIFCQSNFRSLLRLRIHHAPAADIHH